MYVCSLVKCSFTKVTVTVNEPFCFVHYYIQEGQVRNVILTLSAGSILTPINHVLIRYIC